MTRKISSLIILILLMNTAVYAHTATVAVEGYNKYKSVRLTPQIYNNANYNLSDILLYNEADEIVPYFINSYTENTNTEIKNYKMRLINSFTKDEYYYMDYAVSGVTDRDILATSIELETSSKDFAKKTELYGGYDNINWEKVKDDTLYRVNDSQKLSISFEKPLKYTHYRFKLLNNLEKIQFSDAELEYSVQMQSKEYFSETLQADYTAEQKDKQTVININGLKNIKINQIIIDTDSIFKRTASLPNGKSKQIYHLDFNNTIYMDTTLPAEGFRSKDDVFAVTIDNKDDKPINIKGIKVSYFVDEVIFEAQSGNNCKILFGDSTKTTAPSYDISNYKDMILKEDIDKLAFSSVNTEADTNVPKPYDYKMIFNIVITTIAVLLGVLIILKLKKK